MLKQITLTLVLAGLALLGMWQSLLGALASPGQPVGGAQPSVMVLTKTAAVLPPLLLSQTAIEAQRTAGFPYNTFNSAAFFFPPYPSANERMGFGKASRHDTSALNAGWYVDWNSRANPAHPGGVEYAHTIYLNVSGVGRCSWATEHSQIQPRITGTALLNNIARNPGALWLVGNEPDSLYNGSPIHPELYAEIYHDFYHFIKEADPTARVAVAAIVQPSPLRMEYLDQVMSHYESTFSETLQSDLWNIHFYLLNEAPCNAGWGSSVPPASSSARGWRVEFTADHMLDVERMRENLRAFRAWMKERGQQDRPLIITEFGILPPPSYSGFSDARAVEFMQEVTPMFLTATDADVGYPADDYRLLQFWAWFSSDHAPPPGWFKYGGDLYKTGTADEQTIIGEAFTQLALEQRSPYVSLDLVPDEPPIRITSDTLEFSYFLRNRGNTTATQASVTFSLMDPLQQRVILTKEFQVSNLGPRYSQPPVHLEHTWLLTDPQRYTLTVRLNAGEDVIAPGQAQILTLAQPFTAQVSIPADAVTETIGLTLTAMAQLPGTIPEGYQSTNRAVQLTVSRDGQPQPRYRFARPLRLSLSYGSPAPTGTVAITRTDLLSLPPMVANPLRYNAVDGPALFWYSDTGWVPAEETCPSPADPQHVPAAELVQAAVCRSGEFALFTNAPGIFVYYLPHVSLPPYTLLTNQPAE